MSLSAKLCGFVCYVDGVAVRESSRIHRWHVSSEFTKFWCEQGVHMEDYKITINENGPGQ